jgi:hypothetical protein
MPDEVTTLRIAGTGRRGPANLAMGNVEQR